MKVPFETVRAERNTESAHGRVAVRLDEVGAVFPGAILVLVMVGGQSPFLADVGGRITTTKGSGFRGSVGLVGAQLRVLPLYAVLAWLLVVALDLALATWPARSAYESLVS